MKTIAFQGERGAYSEEAIRQHFGEEVETLPRDSFDGIFAAVNSDEADLGAVPVENSTAGSINRAYDLLLENDLKVHGEIILRVRHNLLAAAEFSENITHVRSHPQALAQCERFLNEEGYIAVSWYDTAGAARDLAADPEEGVGVIASALAAEIYGLEILRRDIEDSSGNFTRFFLVGRGEAPRSERSKTSLIFAVPHTPGSLVAALRELSEREINLTKLESRPRRDRTWEYLFYVDFEGHWEEEKCRNALAGLLNRAAFLKSLGSYPAADPLADDRGEGQREILQI